MATDKFKLPDPLFFFDGTLPQGPDQYFAIMEKNETGAVEPGTHFMRNDDDGWHYLDEVEWNAVSVTGISGSICGMLAGGEDGQIAYCTGEEISEIRLSDIYKKAFTLRKLHMTDDNVIAVGYGGVLFAMDSRLNWSFEVFQADVESSWIEAVAVDADGRRYLVGLNGEMWFDTRVGLRQAIVPTNAHLHSVCCASSGDVYVCGSNGTLLVGREDNLQLVEAPSGFEEDFWRVAELGGRIWVSSMTHVFEWLEDGLVLSDFGAAYGIKHYYNLKSSGTELFVVDEKHVLAFDGDTHRLIC